MSNTGSFPVPFQHISLPPPDRVAKPSTTASTSMADFSFTTSMENGIFRAEASGRRFQATNDDYALPADEEEERRLNIQHRGWKATNGGKNYVAPMDVILVNQGEGKRVLDIGTGTGIWAVEMAREFPKAEVIGLDLAPYPTNEELPSNLELVLGDVANGLPYPDGHFDIIHARLIVGGIRDWEALMDEVVRAAKPGGLIVFAESCCPWPLIDPPPEGVGHGYLNLMDLMTKACIARGLDIDAGNITIPRMMAVHPGISAFQSQHIYCPLHTWPTVKPSEEGGRVSLRVVVGTDISAIMLEDAKLIPDTFRLLVIDGCGLSFERYEECKQAFLKDLEDDRVHSALAMWHNWGWRV